MGPSAQKGRYAPLLVRCLQVKPANGNNQARVVKFRAFAGFRPLQRLTKVLNNTCLRGARCNASILPPRAARGRASTAA